MLFKIALVLLVAWLPIAVIVRIWRVDDIGLLVHVPLFVGLMLLPIAFLRAKDAARREDDASAGTAERGCVGERKRPGARPGTQSR